MMQTNTRRASYVNGGSGRSRYPIGVEAHAWARKLEAARTTERNEAVANKTDKVQRFKAYVKEENAYNERRSPIN